KINALDKNTVVRNQNKIPSNSILGDVNNDGKINALDKNTVVRNQNKTSVTIQYQTMK
ncbi:MAG: hypothetical protein HFI72_05635, partial [Peptococcaceae bacterium]|nr:hypothetical protein [Peptococcaceae bacterium]